MKQDSWLAGGSTRQGDPTAGVGTPPGAPFTGWRHSSVWELARLGQLSAGISHELRNPLAVISSCAQFCLENMQLDLSLRENLQMIFRSSQRANLLIRELLAFARPMDLMREKVDVNGLVRQMMTLALLESPSSGIRTVLLLEEGLPAIMGDVERLGRVVLNLILNAVQAVFRQGTLTLETRHSPEEAVVEVRVGDDGPGIPEDYRSCIFDPFFTTKDGGTGLGLSICHSIVTQHGGTIEAECGPSGGTVISVKLPVSGTLRKEP